MAYPTILPNIGNELAEEIDDEINRAKMHNERDEVWDITKQKKCNRNAEDLRSEFIQIAAMAVKAINSMDAFVGGKV